MITIQTANMTQKYVITKHVGRISHWRLLICFYVCVRSVSCLHIMYFRFRYGGWTFFSLNSNLPLTRRNKWFENYKKQEVCPKKLYYSVTRGFRPGIYTLRSKCELNVHKYPRAVFKGFHNIEQAITFLIAGNAFQQCHSIPVIDDTEITKHPQRLWP